MKSEFALHEIKYLGMDNVVAYQHVYEQLSVQALFNLYRQNPNLIPNCLSVITILTKNPFIPKIQNNIFREYYAEFLRLCLYDYNITSALPYFALYGSIQHPMLKQIFIIQLLINNQEENIESFTSLINTLSSMDSLIANQLIEILCNGVNIDIKCSAGVGIDIESCDLYNTYRDFFNQLWTKLELLRDHPEFINWLEWSFTENYTVTSILKLFSLNQLLELVAIKSADNVLDDLSLLYVISNPAMPSKWLLAGDFEAIKSNAEVIFAQYKTLPREVSQRKRSLETFGIFGEIQNSTQRRPFAPRVEELPTTTQLNPLASTTLGQ